MKFSKEELIEIGAHYFEKKEVQSMFATEDGQWFYGTSEGRSYAQGHASTVKCQVFEITRTEIEAEVEEAKSLNEMTVKELKVEVEALEGISEDDIEMVMGLKPKKKIVSFIEKYEPPTNEEEEPSEEKGSEEAEVEEGSSEEKK